MARLVPVCSYNPVSTYYRNRQRRVYYKVTNKEHSSDLSISKFDLDEANLFSFEENQRIFNAILKQELTNCAPEEAAMLQIAGIF